jgi:hypothetical protein
LPPALTAGAIAQSPRRRLPRRWRALWHRRWRRRHCRAGHGCGRLRGQRGKRLRRGRRDQRAAVRLRRNEPNRDGFRWSRWQWWINRRHREWRSRWAWRGGRRSQHHRRVRRSPDGRLPGRRRQQRNRRRGWWTHVGWLDHRWRRLQRLRLCARQSEDRSTKLVLVLAGPLRLAAHAKDAASSTTFEIGSHADRSRPCITAGRGPAPGAAPATRSVTAAVFLA